MTHKGNPQTEARTTCQEQTQKHCSGCTVTRESSRWIFYLTHSHTQAFPSSVAWALVQPSENGGSKITQVLAQVLTCQHAASGTETITQCCRQLSREAAQKDPAAFWGCGFPFQWLTGLRMSLRRAVWGLKLWAQPCHALSYVTGWPSWFIWASVS